jgi:serine/threonine-protein kinase
VDAGEPYAPAGLPVGSQIADYQIEEQVGQGGMATVYRATDVRLQRTVALKVLAPDLAGDAAFRERFIREMRAAAAVDHPHIVPVFDAGEANGALYIAMLYAGGHDVRTLIAAQGPLSAGRVGDIVGQVASALDAAHSRDLIHRDVKPGNMLLASVPGNGQRDHVYLSDFGLSKQSFSSASLTLTGQFLGTIDYMAPEQVEGSPIDGRADLYGLACAAFEMFTGAPPFKRDQNFAAIWAQLSAPAPPLGARRPDLPPAVDQVFARALAKSPDDRYATCGEFAGALRAACGLGTSAGSRASAPALAARPAPRPLRRPAAAQSPVAQLPTVRLGDGRLAEPAVAQTLPIDQTRAAAHAPPAPALRMGQAGLLADPARSWRGAPQWPVLPPAGPPSARYAGPSPRPQPSRQAAPPRSQRDRYTGRRYRGSRSRGAAIAGGIAGCLVMLALAGILLALLRNHHSAPPQPRGSGHSSQPASPAGPAATVEAYIRAINNHNYQRAWDLGGRNTGVSYPRFEQGFDQTLSDNLTIVSVTGDVVTVRLDAAQVDGTVKRFHGSYTVQGGVITVSDIHAGA